MAEDDGVEGRVTELERGLARVEQRVAVASADASAARVLAGGAHEDVAEVRGRLLAFTPVLNALRETQVEDGRTLREVVRIVNGHSGILQGHTGLLQEQSRQLQEHSRQLQEHSVILQHHSRQLQEHSVILREHSVILQEHSVILQEHSVRFDDLETRMANGFAEVNGGMHDIVGLLTQLIQDDSAG